MRVKNRFSFPLCFATRQRIHPPSDTIQALSHGICLSRFIDAAI